MAFETGSNRHSGENQRERESRICCSSVFWSHRDSLVVQSDQRTRAWFRTHNSRLKETLW